MLPPRKHSGTKERADDTAAAAAVPLAAQPEANPRRTRQQLRPPRRRLLDTPHHRSHGRPSVGERMESERVIARETAASVEKQQDQQSKGERGRRDVHTTKQQTEI